MLHHWIDTFSGDAASGAYTPSGQKRVGRPVTFHGEGTSPRREQLCQFSILFVPTHLQAIPLLCKGEACIVSTRCWTRFWHPFQSGCSNFLDEAIACLTSRTTARRDYARGATDEPLAFVLRCSRSDSGGCGRGRRRDALRRAGQRRHGEFERRNEDLKHRTSIASRWSHDIVVKNGLRYRAR